MAVWCGAFTRHHAANALREEAGGPAPGHRLDITATFHRQVATLRGARVPGRAHGHLAEFLRSWLSRPAAQAGLPEGRLGKPSR
jgi:hypothetical protein